MMFAVLFMLLGLFLAGFREGVWRRYTPEDVARWRTEWAALEGASTSHRPELDVPAGAPSVAASFLKAKEDRHPAPRPPRPQPVLEAA